MRLPTRPMDDDVCGVQLQPTLQPTNSIIGIAVATSVGGLLAFLVLIFLIRIYWRRLWWLPKAVLSKAVVPKAPPEVGPFRSQAAPQVPPVSSGDYTFVDNISPVTMVTQLINGAEAGEEQNVVVDNYSADSASDAEDGDLRQATEPTIVRIDPATVSPRTVTPASAAHHGIMEGNLQERLECVASSASTDASAAAATVGEQIDLESAVVAGHFEAAVLKHSSDVVDDFEAAAFGDFEANIREALVDNQDIDPSNRLSDGRDDGSGVSIGTEAANHDGNQTRQQGKATVLGSLVGPTSPGSYTAVEQQQESSAALESAWCSTIALGSSTRHMNRLATIAKRLCVEDGGASVSEAHTASQIARFANLTMAANKLKDVEKLGSLTKPMRLPHPPPAVGSAPESASMIRSLMEQRVLESHSSLLRETHDVEPGQDAAAHGHALNG